MSNANIRDYKPIMDINKSPLVCQGMYVSIYNLIFSFSEMLLDSFYYISQLKYWNCQLRSFSSFMWQRMKNGNNDRKRTGIMFILCLDFIIGGLNIIFIWILLSRPIYYLLSLENCLIECQ